MAAANTGELSHPWQLWFVVETAWQLMRKSQRIRSGEKTGRMRSDSDFWKKSDHFISQRNKNKWCCLCGHLLHWKGLDIYKLPSEKLAFQTGCLPSAFHIYSGNGLLLKIFECTVNNAWGERFMNIHNNHSLAKKSRDSPVKGLRGELWRAKYVRLL